MSKKPHRFKPFTLALAALPLAIGGAACVASPAPSEALGSSEQQLVEISQNSTCVTLFAGQTIEAGEVCVSVDNTVDTSAVCGPGSAGVVVVDYSTSGGWELVEAHLAAGDKLTDIPMNNKGNPVPGQFPYNSGDITGATSHSFSVPLCTFGLDAGLNECDPVNSFFAAHAALRKDNGDGTYQTETGWGDGARFVQRRSWAQYFILTLRCYPECVPGFDADAFEAALEPIDGYNEITGLRVFHQGGNSSQPYFRGSLDTNDDGVFDYTNLPVYCVDLAHTISSGTDYCTRLFSSYSDVLPAEVLHPENLDLLNYIMNTYSIGGIAADGSAFTGGDFQRTYWSLIYGQSTAPGAYSSGPSSDVRVNELLAAAQANGEGFEPPCDGVVGVLVYPVLCEDPNYTITGQALIAQMLVTEFDGACVSCEEEPPLPKDCETAFAVGEQCFLDVDEDGDGKDDFNRWGWREQIDGSYTADIYAGAGQCDTTSKGTLVGSLSVVDNGNGTITVNYSLSSGFSLEETHLYIGDGWPQDPSGGNSVAPGQYTDLHEELGRVPSDSYTLPGSVGDYLIAHAVVCGSF